MAGMDSLLFLKVLCDLEKEEIEAVPDNDLVQELPYPSEEFWEKAKSQGFMKIYMQEKYGIGGSPGSKRYACYKCSCLFRRKRHLRQHLKFHCSHKCLGCSECYANINWKFCEVSGENPKGWKTFTCSSCSSSFLTQAGLAVHEECHPQPDKVLECELCSEHFTNQWEFDRHQKTHVPSVVFDCQKCAKVFSTPSNLAKHVQSRHRKRKENIGQHFLAQFNHDPDSCYDESEEYEEEDSDQEQYEEASSKVCSLCCQSFRSAISNRTHLCSLFPPIKNLGEEIFTDEKFQCPACSKVYSSYIALKMHFGNHTGLDPLTCTLCNKKYSGVRKMDSHYEFHGRNTCKKCGVFFFSRLAVLLHHCGFTHRCFVCDKVFPTRSSFKEHQRLHPMPKSFAFKCAVCKKSFLKESYFRAHQIEHTGTQPFPCALCDQKFLSYGPFKKHVITHLNRQRQKCKICGKYFRTAVSLEAHSKSHLIKVENSFVCENCPKSFETKSELDVHVLDCTGILPEEKTTAPGTSGFECQFCKRVLRKQHQLFLHLRKAHGKETSYLFYCDLCSRGFYHKLHLNSHMSYCSQRNEEERKQISEKIEHAKVDKSVRQYQCSECSRKYFTQQHLNDHMYVHRDPSECPYQCSFCGTGYAREYYLKLHEEKCKVSGTKKPKFTFRCKVCGAKFQSEKTLNRHSKVHGSEWKCSLCNEKFITKRGYSKHQSLCTPETAKYKTFRKPCKNPRTTYSCPTCERTFRLKDRYEAHVASHEGIIRFQCPTCSQKFMSTNNFKRHKCKVKSEPLNTKNVSAS